MRLILHAVALLVAAGLLLRADGPQAGIDPSSGGPTWASGDGHSHDAPIPDACPIEPVPLPGGSSSRSGTDRGPAQAGARTTQRCGIQDHGGEAGPSRAFAPGELPAAQDFLCVNGSANANGARA